MRKEAAAAQIRPSGGACISPEALLVVLVPRPAAVGHPRRPGVVQHLGRAWTHRSVAL